MTTGRHPVFYGKHKYISKAAQSLVDSTGIDDPVQAIEQLACGLLDDVGMDAIPVNLEMLASFQGICAIEEIDMDNSGRLIPVAHAQYRVQVKATDTVGRRNFSCAHEIGHTLIPDLHDRPQTKSDAFTGDYDDADEEEYLCDIAARTLLLPEKLIRNECERVRPSIDGILELSSKFQSSIESVVLRINQLQLWDCVGIIWEKMLKASQIIPMGQSAFPGMEDISEPIEEWRVKFHAWHNGKVIFPAKKHIRSDNPMVQECSAGNRYTGKCIVPYTGGEMNCEVDAQLFPYRISPYEVKNRIISLVFMQ